MKTLREFHKLWGEALDAIEGRDEAQQQALAAQRAALHAQNVRAETVAATTKARADADAHVREQEKAAGALTQVIMNTRAGHEAEMAAAARQAKVACDAASETLEAINAKIRQLRAEHDSLTAKIAKQRASLADAAAKL